jgi:arylsulfatase A-like enzyme
MKRFAFFIFLILGLQTTSSFAQQPSKPNILFIAVDDLKPVLGCYGNKLVKSPNIDRLAKQGTVFMANYCQQAVCGPTRASLMTGKRPDNTKVWDLLTLIRDINPNIITIPGYFKSQGYSTQGIGKVFDSRTVDKENDKISWTVPYYKTAKKYFDPAFGEPAANRYQDANNRKEVEKFVKIANEKGLDKAATQAFILANVRPTVENANVTDNAYEDGANALQAKDVMVQLSKKDEPFFFAVGFTKPHLPFVAPKKYWDMYKREDMPLEKFQQQSKNAVDVAYHNSSEIRLYSDVDEEIAPDGKQKKGLTLSIAKQKELIHGYYAATSYMDANVGLLLNTLDSLGLMKNTIVVLWGDHGWHLGDHNLWCKHTNFEQAARAPLIISSPYIKPSKTSSQTEFIDIFPTLCDLSGLAIPNTLDGKSLVPLMKNPTAIVKEFSVSQYPRAEVALEMGRLGYTPNNVMGYSIRTQRYRYSIWLKDKMRSSDPYNPEKLVGTELYDYQADPLETINVAKEKKYAPIAAQMHKKMMDFFKSQEKPTTK